MVFGFYFYTNPTNSMFFLRSNCSDGTFINVCSVNKPYYCSGKILLAKPSLCGCPEGYAAKGDECIQIPKCSDGSNYDSCSLGKPLFCDNGNLIPKASVCGCTNDYKSNGDNCEKILRCNDSTLYGECSVNVPFVCLNGTLVSKSSKCGCLGNNVPEGDVCVSKFKVGSTNKFLSYTLRGKSEMISYVVYSGLNNYLAGLSRTYICNPNCPSDTQIQLNYLENEEQKNQLILLVDSIKSKAKQPDEQARIAISLVQEIPYDWDGFKTNQLTDRYPYEVIYDGKGVCGEKSRLLAFLLREIGFGVVLINYELQEHMAVGIKCPLEYSQVNYQNEGYCFTEATQPSIMTDNQAEYVNTGKLTTKFSVIPVSGGMLMSSASEEYNDARQWIQLNELAKSSGGILDQYQYSLWQRLVRKYGVKTSV